MTPFVPGYLMRRITAHARIAWLFAPPRAPPYPISCESEFSRRSRSSCSLGCNPKSNGSTSNCDPEVNPTALPLTVTQKNPIPRGAVLQREPRPVRPAAGDVGPGTRPDLVRGGRSSVCVIHGHGETHLVPERHDLANRD